MSTGSQRDYNKKSDKALFIIDNMENIFIHAHVQISKQQTTSRTTTKNTRRVNLIIIHLHQLLHSHPNPYLLVRIVHQLLLLI